MKQKNNSHNTTAFTEGTLKSECALNITSQKIWVALPSANLNTSSQTLTHKHTQTCRIPCHTANMLHISSPQVAKAYPLGYFIWNKGFSGQLHFPQLHKGADSYQRGKRI